MIIKLIRLAIIIVFSTGTFNFIQAQVTAKNANPKLLKCYSKGLSLAKQGQHEDALKIFNKAIKKESNFIDAYIQKAIALDKLERFQDAESNFEKAIAIDPNYDPRVYYALAETEWEQGKFNEAKLHYEQFMASKPKTSGLTKRHWVFHSWNN
ncbi:MAG: tetratricopeptide repeat protein, partial [Bacteroidota bacterium]